MPKQRMLITIAIAVFAPFWRRPRCGTLLEPGRSLPLVRNRMVSPARFVPTSQKAAPDRPVRDPGWWFSRCPLVAHFTLVATAVVCASPPALAAGETGRAWAPFGRAALARAVTAQAPTSPTPPSEDHWLQVARLETGRDVQV